LTFAWLVFASLPFILVLWHAPLFNL
jgi:hypothetical protein